jgi:hypothetical protein
MAESPTPYQNLEYAIHWSPNIRATIFRGLSFVTILGMLLDSTRFAYALPLPQPRPCVNVCCVPPSLFRRNLEAGVTRSISTICVSKPPFSALSRLPSNLILDHHLTMSSWTPSFLLFFESVVVPTAILPPPSLFYRLLILLCYLYIVFFSVVISTLSTIPILLYLRDHDVHNNVDKWFYSRDSCFKIEFV